MTETDDEITAEQVADAQSEHEPAGDRDDEHDDEQDDEHEHAELEPDAEIESSARIEEIGKKLDQLGKHVARRMGDILGEDAQLYRPCMCGELFQTPGWLPPIDPTPDAQAFMYHWMGQRSPSDLISDPYSKPCETCKGEGALASWSRKADAAPLPCPDCESKGWIATSPKRGAVGGALPNGPLPAQPGESISPAPPLVASDTPEAAALRAAGWVVLPPPVLAG
jgi:hypothetical protein